MDKQYINSLLDQFPEIPEEAMHEIWDGVLPHYIHYTKTKSKVTAYCTHCKQEYTVSRNQRVYDDADHDFLQSVAHNKYGACRQCGHSVQFKTAGREYKHLVDYKQVAIVIGTPQAVFIRCYYVKWNTSNPKCAEMRLSEAARYYLSQHEQYLWIGHFPSPYYHPTEYYGVGERAWELRKTVFEWTNGYHLVNSESLAGSFMKYCQLGLYERACWAQGTSAKPMEYLAEYARYPSLEYLLKMGFSKLVLDRVNERRRCRYLKMNANNPGALFKLSGPDLKVLLDNAATVNNNFLNMFYKLRKKHPQIQVEEALIFYHKNKYNTDSIERILAITGLSLQRFLNYINKQKPKDRHESPYRTWDDYLRDCKKLGYDLTNEAVTMPKDLYDAHQQTISLIKYAEQKHLDPSIKKRAKRLSSYAYTDGTFLVRAPLNTREIIDEGAKLNHCVGGYAERHAKGTTNILFIRLVSDPETPYFTVEIGNEQRIRQIQGYENKAKKPESLQQFIEDWKAHIAGDKAESRIQVTA